MFKVGADRLRVNEPTLSFICRGFLYDDVIFSWEYMAKAPSHLWMEVSAAIESKADDTRTWRRPPASVETAHAQQMVSERATAQR
jgi:hypothetical protein